MTGITAHRLVERLGRHLIGQLGIDPSTEGGLEGWLVAAILQSSTRDAATARRAFGVLDRAGAAVPSALAEQQVGNLATLLEQANLRKPEAVAARLIRIGTTLRERWSGSLEALASDADGLDELGSRIASLAPGVGVSTVLGFLRPLRESWSSAADTPASRAALAAARHLGWAGDETDEASLPGVLQARVSDGLALRDIEAALERLGSRSCLRSRTASCPLGDDCPARQPASAGGPDGRDPSNR